MTEDEELQAALEKAIALCKRVDKLVAELPEAEQRDAGVKRMKHAAHSTVGNLAQAMKVRRG